MHRPPHPIALACQVKYKAQNTLSRERERKGLFSGAPVHHGDLNFVARPHWYQM